MSGQPCFHCGDLCEDRRFTAADKVFCCQGCHFVHDLLAANGLGHFYVLSSHPGPRQSKTRNPHKWACLDEPQVQAKLLDYTDGRLSRVTFHIPAIHCVACVWLLENLFRLHDAIGASRVNFPQREVSIQFAASKLKLSELAEFLSSLGYEPSLTLDAAAGSRTDPDARRRWIQMGVAGFAFGNIMLFSLPAYLGLDRETGPLLHGLFGWLSLALALPVATFSAGDFWKTAWLSLCRRMLTIEVPIALGLAVIYCWSVFEVVTGRGAGYCDSLTGLVFLLLCGRAFQGKVRQGLEFDRDYKSFFPLAVTCKRGGIEASTPLSQVCVGDRLIIRNGELIPADATLADGIGLVDYSFVTGESAPVMKGAGDHLFAGGKQIGASIEVLAVKPVVQSYLASLWDQDAFRKEPGNSRDSLTNRYSQRFTLIVITVALSAGALWSLSGDVPRAIKAFASVLIVACPCALALAAPFALGTGQRVLSRLGIFVKNPIVLERLARVSTIVLDKTGTLTSAENSTPIFSGTALGRDEEILVGSLARHSTHPYSIRIYQLLRGSDEPQAVVEFEEEPGLGIAGKVRGHDIVLGSMQWMQSRGIYTNPAAKARSRDPELVGGTVSVAVDGVIRGHYTFEHSLRPETARVLAQLSRRFTIALLSGDNERERERFEQILGDRALLRFNQSPFDKLQFIQELQGSGAVVMMVGDGLNDAGALKQSDVGVAVVGKAGVFSPASDIILESGGLAFLPGVLHHARWSVGIVRLSFAISAAYNLVGIGIAAAGLLSPVICAVLMPLSSVTVAVFACSAAGWSAARCGLALRPGTPTAAAEGAPLHTAEDPVPVPA